MDEEYAHFNIRCSVELRDDVEKLAKKQGQSLAEWVRRAMQEKLDRESRIDTSDDEYVKRSDLKKALDEMLEKMEKNGD